MVFPSLLVNTGALHKDSLSQCIYPVTLKLLAKVAAPQAMSKASLIIKAEQPTFPMVHPDLSTQLLPLENGDHLNRYEFEHRWIVHNEH